MRAAACVCAVAAVGLGLSGAVSFASGPALTVTPISWTVVGLDSNSPSTASLPHIYPIGARVCNTGTDPATNVSAKWTWGDTTGTNSIDQAFNGPAQNTSQTIGTIAGGGCQDVYFNVDVKQSGGNSSKTHSQNQNIIVTADGGLSVTETKLVYVESLVSQNRNTVKGWTGPGGCNLTYTVCDPAPTHVYVGQQYTFKLYAQTSTAYDELEAFATWPSFITLNSATSTYSTISAPGSSTSSSVWADSCTWGSMTSSSSGACSTSGKAGGKTVVTYKITPTTAGTATAIQPMIYDHSGSSFHYNSGFTTSLEAVEADWKLSATVVGDGMVTSSPNGFTSTGTSAAISCGTSGTTCDVGYANNTSVTLTAAPGSGQTFTGWSGGSCSGTATTCVVTMNQARSVTATFTGTTHYPLITTKYGSGTVTAGDSSISCGSTCSASYASGTSVTLTAAASTGWKFTGWSGDCASSGTSPTCIVTMSQARNVTASFDEQTYTLTVSATGTGAGNLCSNNSNQSNAGLCSPGSEAVFISCGSSTSTTNYTDTICTGTYPAGQSATLYPMCNGGSSGTPCPGGSGASTVTFGGYTGGTCSGSSTTGCAFTMDQDRTVSANFVLGNTATPDLTISKSHVGNFSQGDTGKTYTLTVSNVGTGAGYTGKTITVTDAPPTGLTITAMSGTGWTCTVATKSCTQSLASNISAGGSLNPITVTVSVAANASTPLVNAATVACASSCTNDTSNDTASDSTTILTPADLTLTKSHSGNFTQGATGAWTLAVTNSGGQATSGAVTVTDALPSGFTKNAVSGTGWDCSASTSTNISCTRSDALASGSSYPAITVTANVGATAVTSTNTASVSGGGETNTSNNSASDPTTVLAHLTVATAGNGSGTVTDDLSSINCGSTCSADYATGTAVTLTATSGTGSTFTGWSGDIGSCTATATTCQVTMNQARSITATFTLQTFTLQVTTSGTGTGTVTPDVGGISCNANTGTCSKTYDYGTTVTLSQAADGGSTFSGWSGACTVSGSTCVATMTQARSVGAAFDLGTSPFLSVSKSHTGSFRQGDTGDQYTISVSNTGTAATSGLVTVTDTVPAGLTPTAATGTGWHKSDGSGTDTCSISGQAVTCTRTDALAASGTYPSITVSVDVAATAASSVTNSASVSGGGCSSSPCSSTTDPTTVVQNPRLTVAKSHSGNFSQSDPNDQYTITVSNGSGTEVGPTSGTVTVSDTVPTGLTPTAATGTGWHKSDGSGTDTCSVSGQVVTCTRSDVLARGGSYPAITVSVDVAVDAPASVTNSASVSGGGCASAPCSTASDPTTVVQDPRLSITKTHTGSFRQGETGDQYTITVSNGAGTEVGPTTVTVTVTDTVPTGLTPTAATGTGWHKSDGSGTDTCSVSGQVVTCTRSDVLARAASYPAITLSVDVASNAPGSVTNSASVSGGGCTASPCGTASDPTTIIARYDLTASTSGTGSGSVTSDVGTINCGSTCVNTYDDGTVVTLTANVASGTTFLGWSGDCTGTSSTCQVTMSRARSVSAAFGRANLDLTKTAVDTLHQGDTGRRFTIAVKNIGDGPTTSAVTVTESPPTGLTVTGLSGTGWTCDVSTLVCSRSDALASGTSYPDITVVVSVAINADPTLVNSARVSGGGCSASPCDVSTASAPVAQTGGSISGRVFEDKPGSPGLMGWTVFVDLNDSGSLDSGEQSGTTDASGNYRISGLGAGSYRVRELANGAWTCSQPTPCSYSRTISSGGSSTGNDFANWLPGSIDGTVYDDSAGHSPLADWTVYLDLNGNGAADFGEPTSTTDANGGYSFSSLARGHYTVREMTANGWTCSTPQPCTQDATIESSSAITGLDFGNWAHALLRGHKFEDANRDGLHQAGESPLGGWTIYVDYNDNGVLDAGEPSSVTLPNGYYGITGIAAGTWSVREVGQPDWTCSAPSGCAHRITFAPDSEVDGKDFLNWAPARVTGHVWDDLEVDGVRDPNEPLLPGWIVYVDYNGDGKLDAGDISTVTDDHGNYSMGVKPGTWSTREIAPEHWICNFPTPCAQTFTFASGSTMSGDFGNYRLALLSGTMFNDLNRDGGQDPGEPGLGGWRVYVDYNDNGRWDDGEPFDVTSGGVAGSRTLSSVRGAPGRYTITGIEPGNWSIREDRKSGFPCTLPFSCEYKQRFLEDSKIEHRDFATFKPLVTGRATLAVPDMCVADTFVLRFVGSAIQRIDLSIAPGKHLLLRGRGLKHETLATRIDAAAMGVGPHRVFANVSFTKASGTASKRFSAVFYRCASVAPGFTG